MLKHAHTLRFCYMHFDACFSGVKKELWLHKDHFPVFVWHSQDIGMLLEKESAGEQCREMIASDFQMLSYYSNVPNEGENTLWAHAGWNSHCNHYTFWSMTN